MSFWGMLKCPICIEIGDSWNFVVYYTDIVYASITLLTESDRMRRARYKQVGNLNRDIYSIIIGSLLGDAYAENRTNTRICL